jgi:hypothetical protein
MIAVWRFSSVCSGFGTLHFVSVRNRHASRVWRRFSLSVESHRSTISCAIAFSAASRDQVESALYGLWTARLPEGMDSIMV